MELQATDGGGQANPSSARLRGAPTPYSTKPIRLRTPRTWSGTRKTTEVKVRFVQADVAIVHARFTIVGARDPDGKLRQPLEGIGTRIVRKQSGRWETVATQYTNVVTSGR